MDSSDDEAPVPYLQRTRDWYAALGFGEPYRWAQFDAVPFQPLRRPLAEATVALVTTAAPYQPERGPQGPGAPYNAAAKFYRVYSGDTALDHDLRIAHVAIDRRHTSMADCGSWFPLPALRATAERGRIGRVARRFHGAPTNRSQRHTLEVDAPEVLRRCQEDGVDAAVLVPNCPVCHQSMTLIARTLEAAGIATVVMGCARDIVEHVGAPRLLFSDFPLGNSAGKPHDAASQAATLELALGLLEGATGPRTTLQSPQRWSVSAAWKRDYNNAALLDDTQRARLRTEFEQDKETARQLRAGPA
jgi:D-proline reductase (dithiol) PrdB